MKSGNMINFRLLDFNLVEPGDNGINLMWYYLTEGELWLNFGDVTLYEYSEAAIQFFNKNPTRYNDYYISRFIDDFTEIFEIISEPITERMLDFANNLNHFYYVSRKYLEKNTANDNVDSEKFFDNYDLLTTWIEKRTLNSNHLIGGPKISFFRVENNLKIIYSTNFVMDNGIKLWVANSGYFEMDYFDFINEIEIFGGKFFRTMKNRITKVTSKEWGINFKMNKIVEEHIERENDFKEKINLLKINRSVQSNAEDIESFFNEIKSEYE
jgi:hypothetical protein